MSAATAPTTTSHDDALYPRLMEFYKKHPQHMATFVKIVTESTLSLRIIEWFVTNYAKQYGTEYVLKTGDLCRVNVGYRLLLKSYHKKFVDPFCRGKGNRLIHLPYNDTHMIETTHAQLNFFKWAFENEIIDYITANYDAINADMQKRGSNSLKRARAGVGVGASAGVGENNVEQSDGVQKTSVSIPKTRKKRRELSVSAIKNVTCREVEIVLKFNV